MAKKVKPAIDMEPKDALVLEQHEGETGAQAMARKLLEPNLRHALTAAGYGKKVLGGNIQAPGIADFALQMEKFTDKAAAGDLSMVSKMLAAQATTLDSMFTELARRASSNMDEYLGATDRFGRLALKAQSNCRTTLEALAKLHQPREQTVRHVHVNEGGQAVIADEFHHHQGALENGKTSKQSHAADALAKAPRCLAKTRAGSECQSPAVKGKGRCRMHGGTNPGAPKGNRNAWKHGARSRESICVGRWLKKLAEATRK